MPIQPAAQPASSSPPSRLCRRLTALRDILLVLCWTDSLAGRRIRLRLQRRFARGGQSPRGARRMASLRLAAALGTSERFWLGLQADYDLEEAHRALGKAVDRIERIAA